MPAVQIFSSFKEAIAEGAHNLETDTLKVALSNSAPSLSYTALPDIVQIGPTGGYAAETIAVTSSAQAGGTYSLTLGAVTFTASGAAFNEFRYIILYDETASNKLIGFFDYGAGYTLADGQSFTINAGTWLTNA